MGNGRALSRAKSRTLNKDILCRGPAAGALVKEAFTEGPTLSKEKSSAKMLLANFTFRITATKARHALPRAIRQALGKDIFIRRA